MCECESYSFLYFCVPRSVWSDCQAQVFKGADFFSNLSPLQRMIHTVNVWLFWDDHALSLLCIQLKSFFFTFSCDFWQDILPFFFSESSINTVSSAYLSLFMLLPPTLIPSWCFVFRRIILLYILKRSGEKGSLVSLPYILFCSHCNNCQFLFKPLIPSTSFWWL